MHRNNFQRILGIDPSDLLRAHLNLFESLENHGYDMKTCTSIVTASTTAKDIKGWKPDFVSTPTRSRSKKKSTQESEDEDESREDESEEEETGEEDDVDMTPVDDLKQKPERKRDSDGFAIPDSKMSYYKTWVSEWNQLEHSLSFTVQHPKRRTKAVFFVKDHNHLGVDVAKAINAYAVLCEGCLGDFGDCVECKDIVLISPCPLTDPALKAVKNISLAREATTHFLTIGDLLARVESVRLVSKHTLLTRPEVELLCAKYGLTDPQAQLPAIAASEDAIAKRAALAKGEIVKADPVAKLAGWAKGDIVRIENHGFMTDGYRVVI